jgi:hypothetical protein
MMSFKSFVTEAWTNGIGKESREVSVSGNKKYSDPEDFKKGSEKIGSIGDLNIHKVETGGGMTVFTHHPGTGLIHHVIHSVQATESERGGPELKFLSAHGREKSPVRTGDLYRHLSKQHNFTFVGTGHSPGAQKMWSRFHDDPAIEVLGRHSDGNMIPLEKNDRKYADKKTTDPEEKKIGRMELVARKRMPNG